MAIVTPTDLLKSVHNRCVIEVFCGVFVDVTLLFEFSVSVAAFVIELSQISFLLITESVYDLEHRSQGQNHNNGNRQYLNEKKYYVSIDYNHDDYNKTQRLTSCSI